MSFTEHRYMVKNRWDEWRLDAALFASDLQPILGGKVAPRGGEGDERRTLVIGELQVMFTHPWEPSKRGRVEVHTGSTLSKRLKHQGTVRDWPKATFDAGRPIDQLAKEIKVRLIDPAQPKLKETREALRDEQRRQKGVRTVAAEITEMFPNVSVTFENDLATEGHVYVNGKGTYLSARLTADGGLYVDRVGSLSAGRTMRFIAALAGETND